VAIPPLILRIIADSSSVKKGVAETDAQVSGLKSTMAGISKVAVAGFAVAGLAVAKFGEESVQAFQQVAGDTRMLEKQLGITAEQASVLRAQAEALGVPVDKLSIGFGLFAKHLVAGDDVLKQYGITLATTADGSIDFQNVLAQVSAKFNAMGPGVERTAASMNLFGRSGKNLLPLLSSNSDELARLAQSAKDAGLIMSEDDVNAARAFGIAQRQLGEAVKGLEVNIGRDLVPSLQQVVESFTKLVEAARPLAEVVFKSVADAATSASQGLSEVSSKITDLLGVIPGLKAQSDDSGFSLATLAGAVIQTGSVMDLVRHPIGHFTNTIQRFKEAFGVGSDSAAGVLDQTSVSLDSLATKFGDAAQKLSGFAGMTRKETKDFRDSVVFSLGDAIGSLTNFDKNFGLTADHAVKGAKIMADKAKDIARDYKALDDQPVLPKFKAWLLEQGPDAVHAYVKANQEGQQQIRDAWKSIQASLEATTKTINQMLKGQGTQAGVEYANGMAAGMASRLTWVGAAGKAVAHAAVVAAKAELGSQSPSKVMEGVGIDFMQGLINGISKMVSTFDEVVGKALTHSVSRFSHDLEQLKTRISGWRSDIQSGFQGFDLIGGLTGLQEGEDPAAFLQQQLMAAQQFGAALTGLQAGGLHGKLLMQIASQGPQALPLAQTLLADPELLRQLNQTSAGIQRIAESTRREVIHEEFGGAIDRLGDRLERVINRFPNIDITIQGWVGNDQALAEKIRDELAKLGRRNVTAGIP